MRAGERVRVMVLVGTSLTKVLAFSTLVYGAVLLSASSVDAELVAKTSPVVVSVLLLVLLVVQIFASGLAFHAALRKIRTRLERYFVAQIVLSACTLALFMYVLLVGNGVTSGGVSQLTEEQERLVTLFALENSESWKAFQDTDRDGRTCCGLNARSTYLSVRGGFADLPTFTDDAIFSGDACVGAGQIQLAAFKASFPIFNETAEASEPLTPPFSIERFICFDSVVEVLRDFALVGGVLAGVVLFLGVFSAGAVATLLYSVKTSKGGLKPMNSFVSDKAMEDAAFGGRSKHKKFGAKKKGQAEKGHQVVVKFDAF